MNRIKIGCIGIGVMGSALMEAVVQTTGQGSLTVYDPDRIKLEAFCRKTGAAPAPDNASIAASCDWVFLAVKPQYLPEVLAAVSHSLKSETILVSMAAGVQISKIRESTAGHRRIVRIMPNTPASVGSGVIAIAADPSVSQAETEELQRMLSSAGITETTPESLMDAVTAISGSGPAYGYVFIDALADAAVQMGMPRAQALRYAAATLRGAGDMVLKTGTHPAVLKDAVCSPGGTTIAAVTELEESGFRAAVIKAARSAWKRSRELGS